MKQLNFFDAAALCRVAFEELLSKNGSTTSLEVKEYLRKVFSSFEFNQELVSASINAVAQYDNRIKTTSNGLYNTYTLNKLEKKSVPLTQLAEKVASSGKELTITFTKANGDIRVMTCTPYDFDVLGYLLVNENGNTKRVNLRTLLGAVIDNVEYNVN